MRIEALYSDVIEIKAIIKKDKVRSDVWSSLIKSYILSGVKDCDRFQYLEFSD